MDEKDKLLYQGVCERINDENTLAHRRMTWFMTMNFGVLAACGTNWFNGYAIVFLPVIGLVISLSMWQALWTSAKAIDFILRWWKDQLLVRGLSEEDFPPVWAGNVCQYTCNDKLDKTMKKYSKIIAYKNALPCTFCIIWCIALAFSIYSLI